MTQARNGSRIDKEKGISERGLILFYGYHSSWTFLGWTVSSLRLASCLCCSPEMKLGPVDENCWVSDFCSVLKQRFLTMRRGGQCSNGFPIMGDI